MLAPTFLTDQLTNLLVLESEGHVTCQVLATGIYHPSQSGQTKHDAANAVRLLRDVEIKLFQLDTLCFLHTTSARLWVFHGQSGALRASVDELAHDFDLESQEPLGMNLSLNDLLSNKIPGVRDAFLCSVVGKVSRAISGSGQAVMLNPRTMIVYSPAKSHETQSSSKSSNRSLNYVASIDLEYAGGNIVLSVRGVHDVEVNCVSQMLQGGIKATDLEDLDAWLAPCGRPARLKAASSWSDQIYMRSNPAPAALRQAVMKDCVTSRLLEHGIPISNDESWIDATVIVPSEMPASEELNEGKEQNLQVLRSILWPSSLIFSTHRPSVQKDSTVEAGSDRFYNPMKAAEMWFAGSAARADKVGKRKAAKVAEQVQKDRLALEAMHREDAPATSPAATRSYTDINSAAAIYPTPPDGPLSHVTPGVSSIDGTGVTPSDPTDLSRITQNEMQNEDVDMEDSNPVTDPSLFDDDLFEDKPGENSESGEMDNDPDWDFFDEPDAHAERKARTDDMDVEDQENEDTLMDNTESGVGSHQEIISEDTQTPRAVVGDDRIGNQGDMHTQAVVEARPSAANTSIPTSSKNIPSTSGHEEANSALEKRKESVQDSSHIETGNQFSDPTQDAKYAKEGGRFWFGQRVADASTSQDEKRFPPFKKTKPGGTDRTLETKPGQAKDDDSSDGTRTPSSSGSTPFDSSEMFSEDDTANDPWTTLKRKWTETAEVTSPAEQLLDDSERSSLAAEYHMILDGLFEDVGQWPMDAALQPSLTESASSTKKPEDDVQLAQLLVDQISQSFVLHNFGQKASKEITETLVGLWKSVGLSFGSFQRTTLQQLFQVCASSSEAENTYATFQTPKIRVKRGDKELEALPSLLRFWETFGLQPSGGTRNVTAFCMQPPIDSVVDTCATFLSQIGQVYRGCNLGNHQRGPSGKLFKDGLIPWKQSKTISNGDFSDLSHDLGHELAHLSISSTILLYIVHPLQDFDTLVNICRFLLALFMAYAKSSQEQQKALPEIVFQIVPLSFMADEQSLVVPSQIDYLRLALEIYDRCPPTIPLGDEVASSAPAVLLANQSLKSIKFDLSSSSTSPVHDEGNVLHVAYSQSTDERWITAAWTDNYGKKALTMSYCLRSKGAYVNCTRPISAIVKEIWETSMDITTSAPGSWRIIVCREGPIPLIETNAWIYHLNSRVSTSSSTSAKVSLLLLTVDNEPAFKLLPLPRAADNEKLAPPSQAKSQAQSTPTTANFAISSSNPPVTYGTPVSTPTPTASQTVLSPEQMMTANTPGAMSAQTPTPSASAMGQSQSQQSYIPPQSPAASHVRANTGYPQTPQSQSQPQQSAAEIQATLESDPTAVLLSSSSEYSGLLSPYPMRISRSLLDHRVALASAYLLRHCIEPNLTRQAPGAGRSTSSPETIIALSLIWTSLLETQSPPTDQTRNISNAEATRSADADDLSDSDLIPEPKKSNTSFLADDGTLTTAGNDRESTKESDASAQARNLLLYDVLPLYRNLITLSETKGMALANSVTEREDLDVKQGGVLGGLEGGGGVRGRKEKVLPWHIMTVVRGKRILERSGL